MSVPYETVVDQIEGLIATDKEQPQPETEPNAQQTEEPETPAETEEPEAEPETESEPETAEAEEDHIQTLDELINFLETDQETILGLKTKAKVNGEEMEVTLNDLVRSYQLDKYNDKKSKDIESQRRAFEKERTDFQETQRQYNEQMESLKVLEQHLSSLVAQDNEINWADLRENDPVEYVRLKEEARERQDALAKVEAAKQKEADQQMRESQRQYEALISQEQRALYDAIPEWADEKVASSERAALQDYLAKVGFQRDEIDNIIDHRAVILTRKAMMFDKLNSEKTIAKKKVKSLPKVLKPGAAQSKADAKSEKLAELQKRLKKSGSIDDFAEILLEG